VVLIGFLLLGLLSPARADALSSQRSCEATNDRGKLSVQWVYDTTSTTHRWTSVRYRIDNLEATLGDQNNVYFTFKLNGSTLRSFEGPPKDQLRTGRWYTHNFTDFSTDRQFSEDWEARGVFDIQGSGDYSCRATLDF
jgi:hypothetical protein